jgi:hypothetical protein
MRNGDARGQWTDAGDIASDIKMMGDQEQVEERRCKSIGRNSETGDKSLASGIWKFGP